MTQSEWGPEATARKVGAKPVQRLGNLTAADLGSQIRGGAAAQHRTKGTPVPPATISGTLESIHHFRVGEEDWSAAIVRIVRNREQVKKREPDCREIRGPSATEVEIR